MITNDSMTAGRRRAPEGGRDLFRGSRLPLIIALVAVLSGPAIAQTYRWTDAEGEIHVTDDPNKIPERYRPHVTQPAPTAKNPSASPGRGAASGQGKATPGNGVALWVRTGGIRGASPAALIHVYDSAEACQAEKERRAKVHVGQGMQPTSQPGLAISDPGGTMPGPTYFAYICVPAGVRPP